MSLTMRRGDPPAAGRESAALSFVWVERSFGGEPQESTYGHPAREEGLDGLEPIGRGES